MNKEYILNIIKKRDEAFIAKFCQKGNYIGDNGNQIMQICRPVNADEMLTFMHQWDAALNEGFNE